MLELSRRKVRLTLIALVVLIATLSIGVMLTSAHEIGDTPHLCDENGGWFYAQWEQQVEDHPRMADLYNWNGPGGTTAFCFTACSAGANQVGDFWADLNGNVWSVPICAGSGWNLNVFAIDPAILNGEDQITWNGQMGCGFFDMGSWGPKQIILNEYPDCPSNVTVACLGADGTWSTEGFSNVTGPHTDPVDASKTYLSLDSEVHGLCALFPG